MLFCKVGVISGRDNKKLQCHLSLNIEQREREILVIALLV